jgi:hypothetical protein
VPCGGKYCNYHTDRCICCSLYGLLATGPDIAVRKKRGDRRFFIANLESAILVVVLNCSFISVIYLQVIRHRGFFIFSHYKNQLVLNFSRKGFYVFLCRVYSTS